VNGWLLVGLLVWASSFLSACAAPTPPAARLEIASRLLALLPADAILLGEQHDNADHQRIQHEVVALLAARGVMAALVIEMAAAGTSSATLAKTATEAEVKTALNWDDKAWPWASYAPAVMAAVQSGAPVLGANLPRAALREAMANTALDARLDAVTLQRQHQLIREGHCDLLPASQIAPMTRVQIARDLAMAQSLASAASAARQAPQTGALPSGKTVVLIAGSVHVDKSLGIQRHLGSAITSKSVLLAGGDSAVDADRAAGFDAVWPTLPAPKKDYCAELRKSMSSRAQASISTLSSGDTRALTATRVDVG
jgi:uncharacterized iron-regulated protein